jgi:7,8-dihydropterin-6-yl-methyl-4-(beta-D-ribofuranosyl)aminobenzene 5'-phosphate synthase
MIVRATVLVDERAPAGTGLATEHGLCVLVQAGEASVLLDAGLEGACVQNAARLRADLSSAQPIVLSHGHYDHTGGLAALLGAIGPREVVAHPAVFGERYAQRKNDARRRRVGIPVTRDALEAVGASFRLEAGPTEVGPGIMTTGVIPRQTEFETPNPDLFVSAGRSRRPDPFEDDQALVVRTRRGPVVILGCAHAGVVNTLRYAAQLAGSAGVHAVMGGMHLLAAGDDQIEQTIQGMRDLGVERIMPCHCTGEQATARLAEAFGSGFTAGAVGSRLDSE